MTITTQVTHTETREVEIPVPSFWKEPTTSYDCYRALLDEKTFVEFSFLPPLGIYRMENSAVGSREDKISEACQKWDIITEERFFTEWNKAYESMRLTPALKVDATC